MAMAVLRPRTFSLDGLGVYSMCARFVYSGNNGDHIVVDCLEQDWVLAVWDRVVQDGTWRSDEVRAAMSALMTSSIRARHLALQKQAQQVGYTTYAKDAAPGLQSYYEDIRSSLGQHLPAIGFSPQDTASVVSNLDAIHGKVSVAVTTYDEICRASATSGSMIMELTYKANQTVFSHIAGRPVQGINDIALQSESDLSAWFSALKRIKYYQDKRMTLDEVLGDFVFRESNTLFQVRENEEGLPRLYDDESYSRIYGSELLVFESARWMSFKFRGSILNFQKTNRAVSCRMGTDIHPTAVQTALLLGPRESFLSVPRIKEALERLVTYREKEIEKIYQLTLEKDDHYEGKEEDIAKEIMSGVRIKRTGDRMGIAYCDTEQRIGAAIRNARISGVKFNGHIRAGDIEFEHSSQDDVEFLAPVEDYSEFQTASDLDAWFESVLKNRGVLGDRKYLRDMLRARVEKLIAIKFGTVQVNGPEGCWARLYRLSYMRDKTVAEYFADLPHMITSKTTLEADASGKTKRGFMLVRTGANMWHIKESLSEPGIPVIGRIELKKGDFLGLNSDNWEEERSTDGTDLRTG